MDTGTVIFRGVLTLVLMGAFLGIWIWAWSSKRKTTFDALSRLPLEDDGEVGESTDRSGGSNA